jgi:hypothetical protein
MPEPFALKDSDLELIRHAITVSMKAAEAAKTGNNRIALYAAMQAGGVEVALRKLLSSITTAADALEEGWRLRGAVLAEAEVRQRTLHLVAN